eukprot:comp21792_c0_seq1/m.30971 comp21792_c0_seq1/g.30971  ORF comp21792_c0_seq1/g.30971 comp21792_c0_seq1/m.30971 type:complete len:546 (-) comp21792_c0_seq1:207-1844(-)
MSEPTPPGSSDPPAPSSAPIPAHSLPRRLSETAHVSKQLSYQLKTLGSASNSAITPLIAQMDQGASTGNPLESHSLDVELGDLDLRVRQALQALTAATENVSRIERELEACKKHYRDVIMDGDVKLQAVQNWIGMRKAVERSKPYYMAYQACVKAQDEARIVALQYEKATNIFNQARAEQRECERQLMAEGEGAMAGAGVAVAISLQTQEALNNAAMRVEECRAELQRVELEHRQATQRVETARAGVVEQNELCRGYLEKASGYYEVKEAVERDIVATQAQLDRLVEEATRARKHTAWCLGVLSDLTLETSLDQSQDTDYLSAPAILTPPLPKSSKSEETLKPQPIGSVLTNGCIATEQQKEQSVEISGEAGKVVNQSDLPKGEGGKSEESAGTNQKQEEELDPSKETERLADPLVENSRLEESHVHSEEGKIAATSEKEVGGESEGPKDRDGVENVGTSTASGGDEENEEGDVIGNQSTTPTGSHEGPEQAVNDEVSGAVDNKEERQSGGNGNSIESWEKEQSGNDEVGECETKEGEGAIEHVT